MAVVGNPSQCQAPLRINKDTQRKVVVDKGESHFFSIICKKEKLINYNEHIQFLIRLNYSIRL